MTPIETDLEKAQALFAKLRTADESAAFNIYPKGDSLFLAVIALFDNGGDSTFIICRDLNPLAAANRAKAAYLLLKHGEKVVEELKLLLDLFKGYQGIEFNRVQQLLAPFAATEVE
jgi:hypothetical protein